MWSQFSTYIIYSNFDVGQKISSKFFYTGVTTLLEAKYIHEESHNLFLVRKINLLALFENIFSVTRGSIFVTHSLQKALIL